AARPRQGHRRRMTVRVYVATTLADLGDHLAAGTVPATAERVVAPGDDEESEYDALMTAADLSAASQPAGARRVVVVAELPGDADAEIPWRDVVAVHADETTDADPDDPPAWYAPQEVDVILSRGAGAEAE
ncbi:MAG TPA: hypothetical protein VD859_07610, partial [Nocardioides sp.]|nr:hypothetical protein [Nocardioides sp.]